MKTEDELTNRLEPTIQWATCTVSQIYLSIRKQNTRRVNTMGDAIA